MKKVSETSQNFQLIKIDTNAINEVNFFKNLNF